jgi:hypothetical protein
MTEALSASIVEAVCGAAAGSTRTPRSTAKPPAPEIRREMIYFASLEEPKWGEPPTSPKPIGTIDEELARVALLYGRRVRGPEPAPKDDGGWLHIASGAMHQNAVAILRMMMMKQAQEREEALKRCAAGHHRPGPEFDGCIDCGMTDREIRMIRARPIIHEDDDRPLAILRNLGKRYGIDWGLPKPKRFKL